METLHPREKPLSHQPGEILCFFIRHAEAHPAADGDDAGRALTKSGRHDARDIFSVLARTAPDIGMIFTSPLLRARQTAELLASALRLEQEPEITPLLAGGGPASHWIDLLRHRKNLPPYIAAVGHEPILGNWLSEMCFASGQSVLMKKCAIARVRIEWRSGTVRAELEGLYQPGFMRKIARF
ncbi:MAG: SixA phosphatase family protein [Phycisphaerae bacterium]